METVETVETRDSGDWKQWRMEPVETGETRDSPPLDAAGVCRFLRVRRHLTLAVCTIKIMSRSMQ